jgi:hypothetical protein
MIARSLQMKITRQRLEEILKEEITAVKESRAFDYDPVYGGSGTIPGGRFRAGTEPTAGVPPAEEPEDRLPPQNDPEDLELAEGSAGEWFRLSQYLQAGAGQQIDWPSEKVVDGMKTITINDDGHGHFLHEKGEIRRMKEKFRNLNITKITRDGQGNLTIVTDQPADLKESDQ